MRAGDRYIFDLVFSTNVRLIPIVRRFVNDFYKELFEDADLVSRLALATHELMENAVKYAADPEAQLTIEVTPEASDPKAVIRMRNRARVEDANRVGDLMEALAHSPDPFQFYLELMARTARRPDSGLGLTRVRVEGDMELSHTVTEGCLEITATAALPKDD
jgi:two-component sensor histidine kinase